MASFGKSSDGTYYEWVGDQGSIYTLGNKYVTLSNSSFSSSMRSVIPAYTQLSRVDVCLRWKTSIGSTKGDGYLYIGDTKVGGEWNTGNSWRDDWVNNLQGYFQSGTANAGLPTSEIRGRFEASWGRTSYYVFKIRWYPKYTITVNGGSGGGTYNMGSSVTIKASIPAGYTFVKWSDGNNFASRTVTVTANTTFSAVFEKTTCTATFKNDDGTPLQTVTVEKGSTPSYTGATPTKASTAEYDYTFTGWSPSLGAIDTDTTYTAQFSATRRRYTIVIEVSEGGSVWGAGTYSYGTTVELVATSSYGYKFVGWSDGVTSPSRDVTVTGDATYTAIFEIVKINQVYIGTTQPKAVYVGTREVKAIYLGTTKFYGY